MTININLIEGLTQELQDMVLMNLSSDDIRMIGKDSTYDKISNVSDYVWERKKDRTVMEAILNNNLLGLKCVIENQNIRKVNNLSLQLSAMLGNLDIIKFLVDRYNIDLNENDNIVLLLSAKYGHLDIVKYLVELYNTKHGTRDVNIKDYNRAICWASKNGHLHIIKYFIEESGLTGIDIHADYEEALQQSAKYGHLEVVQFLVEQGANIYIEDGIVFHFSAMNNHLEVVKFLIEHDKDAYKYCEEALLWAANNGHMEVVKYLVGSGQGGVVIHDDNERTLRCSTLRCSINLKIVKYLTDPSINAIVGVSDNTNLCWYIARSNLKEIKTIVKDGADKNIALRVCAEKGDIKAVKYLVENGAHVHAYFDAALRVSAGNGHLPVVQYLIKHDADIHEYEGEALELAVRNCHLSVVKCLIKHGAEIYEPSANDVDIENLVLRIAASNGHLNIVKYMIDYTRDKDEFAGMAYGPEDVVQGASAYTMNHAIKNGQMEIIRYLVNKAADDYSLVSAASNGDLAIMQFLVNQGIDIHTNYEEALRVATKNGHLSMVEYLVGMGANVNKHYIVQHDGDYECELTYSALEWAAEKGHYEIARLLVKHNADIHKGWDNALQLSSMNGHLQIVKCLIEAGANIYTDDEYNAIEWASKYGHLDIVKYLFENGNDICIEDDYSLVYAAENGHLDVVKYLVECQQFDVDFGNVE
jgi:ankyrin repeat protein